MDLNSLLTVLTLAALCCAALFWWFAVERKSQAIVIATQSCQKIQAQLLDQTVALTKLSPSRNRQGRMRWLRHYQFEYSFNGASRQQGEIVLLGNDLLSIKVRDAHQL